MKRFFLALLFLAAGMVAWGQTALRGVVQDPSGAPIVGAGILQVGSTTNGVVTDLDGNFAISVPATSMLEVSCVGYVARQVTVDGQTRLSVILEEDAEMLDDVVVVAFGKMKREAFTGSAGVMKSDDLLKSQVSNAAQALAGRVAGVQITNSSSQPGASPQITIRGVGSISSDTEPLIVVDGMPYDGDINLINSADIESMTVLKDAASNALYGARGANGVIMITTKRGQSGHAKVSFDAKWGLNQNGLPHYETVNTQQFYELYYQMLYNNYSTLTDADGNRTYTDEQAHALANSRLTDSSTGVGPGYMVYTVPTGQDFILKGGSMNPNASLGAFYESDGKTFWLQPDDWERIGLQNGFRQEYNVSVSGQSDKVNYFASLGYLGNNGIQEGSLQKRTTARIKADYQAKPWLKVGGNFGYTHYDLSQTSEGVIGSGTIWPVIQSQAPIYPVYFRDANGRVMRDKWGEPMFDFAQQYGLSRAGGVGGNAVFSNKYDDNTTDGNAFTVGGFADFKFLQDFTFTLNVNIYDYDRRGTYITSPFVDHYTSSNDNGYLYKSSSRTFTYNTQQLLNYAKVFDGVHDVNLMLGHEYYNYKYEYMGMSGKNFGIDGVTEIDAVLQKDPDPSSESSVYNNEGYFARALYNYAGKYYLSGSFRRDASSRFSKKHRWGNFWSVGGAWIVSKEDFFHIPWVNTLKLKFSVGSQGNDNIGNYLYADSYNLVNSDNHVAFQWRQKGSENITWETNTNYNGGIEFELFKGRLNGSLDYFYRKTSDMLFSLNTPPSSGYTSYYTNLGDMRNRGLELDLNGTLVQNRNFVWSANFNLSFVKNKVLKLPDEIKKTTVDGYNGYVNLDGSFVSKYKYFVAEGLPLYTWYYPEYAGVDKETGEALYYMDELDADGNATGKRTTTNNPSNATDYRLGDAMAPLFGGFGTTLQFYGFDLSVNLNFQIGGLARDYVYASLMHTGAATATNWHKDIYRAWTPANRDTDVPRFKDNETYGQNALSSRFITNASYLNLQNVNFGYTLPSRITRKIGVETIRMYFSGENLGFLSMRKGFDPRYNIAGYTNPELYSPIRTLSCGVNLVF